MFQTTRYHEAYWNSYRLLESQLLRLSHSVCFDDDQVDVYSSEIAAVITPGGAGSFRRTPFLARLAAFCSIICGRIAATHR